MSRLDIYTVFHLNLAYSSIEEEQRPEVIRRCYWPLLRLAGELRLPFGIEMSAYTLETMHSIDPSWVEELRRLVREGTCEFIGSGYAQIIGPLVPAEVNAWNLRLGNEVYERVLGLSPRIALVNEQAYSPGLIRHYLDAGYKAMIMEWDNPASCHKEWDPQWRYLPQIACGPQGEEISLIWSKSIAFQKFQRYAHGETNLEEYLSYLAGHAAGDARAFPLYSNDAEIFDFRPGRFHTEAPLGPESEWLRLRGLFEALLKDARFRFVRPSQVLDLMRSPGAGNRLRLESPEQPIPVKKQNKYNVTRWAITGPDDLAVNTACWRIYRKLSRGAGSNEEDWKELCFLWGSDFRTHITDLRWRGYWTRLEAFERNLQGRLPHAPPETPVVSSGLKAMKPPSPGISRQGRYLTVETEALSARFDCHKGLALEGLWAGPMQGPPVCGTLAHGYYDDIALGADWFTGHFVLEVPGKAKVTDLGPVEPVLFVDPKSGDRVIEAAVPTALGPVTKTMRISAAEPVLTMAYRFDWAEIPMGSFRLGNITLYPESFDRSTLCYKTHCGGKEPQSMLLRGKAVEHGAPVSFLVSAQGGIGMTDGWAEIGDARRRLRVEVDQAVAALIGLMNYQEIGDSYFCRLALSAGEMDEARRLNGNPFSGIECRVILRILDNPSDSNEHEHNG